MSGATRPNFARFCAVNSSRWARMQALASLPSRDLATTADRADGLKAALDRATGGNHDTRLFLRADKALSYGDLTGVLNQLRAAGYLKIALVGLEVPAGTFTGTAP